jgi:GT2 family glycosyltransferase/lipopolysaccharide/colanic/teichoic acid biosynthesis glycosyltransferase
MTSEPDLSAIVVAYNSGPGLRRCLDSVRREAEREGITAELLIVDNASTDGCADQLDDDWVSVVRNPSNRGFGAAANQGFRAARARRVLLLNPDARLTEGSLGHLIRELDASPGHALAAPTLRLPDGRPQDSPRRFYDVASVLAQRTPFVHTAAGQRARRAHLMDGWDRASAASVDWVTGAAMLLDRDAVTEHGPFDERYFLYFEDVDLCRRLGGSGREVRFVPDAVVEHDFRRGSRRQVPWNPLLWHHLLSGALYGLRWSSGWWSSRWWRAGGLRLGRAGARAGLLALVGLALALPAPWLAAAVLTTLVVLPSRRSLVVGTSTAPSLLSTGLAVAVGALAASGLASGLGFEPPALSPLLAYAGLGAASLLAGHRTAVGLVGALRRRGLFWRTCLVAGPPERAQELSTALRENPEEGLSVVGYVPLDPLAVGGPTPRLADWSGVRGAARDLRADVVLLCGSPEELSRMAGGVVGLREAGVASAFVLSGTSELLQEEAADTLAGLPVLTLGAGADARALRALRTLVERGLAGALGLVTAPLLGVLAVAVRLRFGRSSFVAAERIGQGGRPFVMWRLRSGPGSPGDEGGGRLGALLRRLHLDELPQLANVLRGEMSLVGPRPVPAHVWERLEEWERARCLVPPGITGMWQLDRLRRWRLEQMIVSDLLYLLRWSPGLDAQILARTLLGR